MCHLYNSATNRHIFYPPLPLEFTPHYVKPTSIFSVLSHSNQIYGHASIWHLIFYRLYSAAATLFLFLSPPITRHLLYTTVPVYTTKYLSIDCAPSIKHRHRHLHSCTFHFTAPSYSTLHTFLLSHATLILGTISFTRLVLFIVSPSVLLWCILSNIYNLIALPVPLSVRLYDPTNMYMKCHLSCQLIWQQTLSWD